MKKIYNPKRSDWKELLLRPTQSVEAIEGTVENVFTDVRKHGDAAIKKYTTQFDAVELEVMKVEQQEFSKAEKNLSKKLQVAIQKAYDNIKRFHEAIVHRAVDTF